MCEIRAKFTDPFKLQITFDCVSPGIKEELEWKLVYVGSAHSEEHDQTLDTVLVGPVAVGRSTFVFKVELQSYISKFANITPAFVASSWF